MDKTQELKREEYANKNLATKDPVPISQVVSFQLATEHYGIDIQNVQEIILVSTITTIPEVPEYVEGLINLRGKVIPVIDLRKRFGLRAGEHNDDTRVIVTATSQRTIGLVVDAVHEVLRIEANQIEPLPHGLTNVDATYITGVVKLEKQILIVLDTNVVISDDLQTNLSRAADESDESSVAEAATASKLAELSV